MNTSITRRLTTAAMLPMLAFTSGCGADGESACQEPAAAEACYANLSISEFQHKLKVDGSPYEADYVLLKPVERDIRNHLVADSFFEKALAYPDLVPEGYHLTSISGVQGADLNGLDSEEGWVLLHFRQDQEQ